MKVYVVIGNKSGVDLHRLILPHVELKKQEPDWEIAFGYVDIEEIGKYDIVIFNRIINKEKFEELKTKYPHVKVVMDLDDYWQLDQNHIMAEQYKELGISELIQSLIPRVDLVITTSPILANKIKPLNSNVKILPNALNPELEFEPKPTQSSLIRLGMIGGISHYTDVDLLTGVVNSLPQKVKDKVQFVLCGFDKTVDEKGNILDWRLNKWNHLEQILSDNYNLVSKSHYLELMQYHRIDVDPKEHYRRIWSRDIFNYGTMYNDIDILLVPLKDTNFNRCKSELKLVEASVMGKAAIVSDVYPYKFCGINAIEHGGTINLDGNCIMVDERKGAKGWAKAITKMVEDEEFRNMTVENLKKLTETKYNLSEVTKHRREIYDELVGNN